MRRTGVNTAPHPIAAVLALGFSHHAVDRCRTPLSDGLTVSGASAPTSAASLADEAMAPAAAAPGPASMARRGCDAGNPDARENQTGFDMGSWAGPCKKWSGPSLGATKFRLLAIAKASVVFMEARFQVAQWRRGRKPVGSS